MLNKNNSTHTKMANAVQPNIFFNFFIAPLHF